MTSISSVLKTICMKKKTEASNPYWKKCKNAKELWHGTRQFTQTSGVFWRGINPKHFEINIRQREPMNTSWVIPLNSWQLAWWENFSEIGIGNFMLKPWCNTLAYGILTFQCSFLRFSSVWICIQFIFAQQHYSCVRSLFCVQAVWAICWHYVYLTDKGDNLFTKHFEHKHAEK